ncbi:MAG: UDP-3-O-(3-hydroxymyristoyl)glucosamine N-acyltransferase [Ferruginibacter sp.]|nr:UDP-3-O-(3-hydroxymyristoyl)glucosamine N-acyltransferase [Ferruginibacter sp.]
MQFSATQIAQIVSGTIDGNPEKTVSSFGKIEEAKAGQLAFLANPKYEDYLYSTNADIIIINESQILKEPINATLIKVPDAYSAFALLLRQYERLQAQQMVGIQEPVYIHATAKKGNDIFIGAFAYIGENVTIGDGTKIYPNTYIGNNVTIGEKTIIHPGVKIYHDCIIGNRVVIHAGTVIGGDGFGFAPQADGSFKKVPQMGNVIVEDYVEVGSNSTIDRATIGSTIIKAGAKIDNLVQIAHNVEVGNNTVIAALSGISGSTKIGNNVMIGGQAGLAGHITIGDGAKINAQSGVGKSLKPGQSVSGSPSYDYNKAIRSQAIARNLPEIEKRLRELEEMKKKTKE